MQQWYEPLTKMVSLGKLASKPKQLGEFANVRKEHMGQFFTPTQVAKLMWKLATRGLPENHQFSVLDNSVGSARLLQFCDPNLHYIAGVDPHEDAIAAVQKVAEEAGFKCDFLKAGMEDINPSGFAIALINPPFSLHLESPTLQPFPCTNYGKYGPNSAALSQFYALAQALQAANIVVAILPRPAAKQLVTDGQRILGDHAQRLTALVHLPAKTFHYEGTDVYTSLAIFDSRVRMRVNEIALTTLDDEIPESKVHLDHLPCCVTNARLNHVTLGLSTPTICTPVTGDRTVRVVHDGRRIRLKFACGLTEAKVRNTLLGEHAKFWQNSETRYPASVKYSGQGKFDLQAYLVQENPLGEFNAFLKEIENAGGKPVVDPGLTRYLEKSVRRTQRELTPLRHSVWQESAVKGAFTATAYKNFLLDPKRWGGPVIKAGQAVKFVQDQDKWYCQAGAQNERFEFTLEEIAKRFEIPSMEAGWKVVHEGMLMAFPEQAKMWRRRIQALGIDKWLTWDFQIDDLIEFLMSPNGAVCGWNMGLGKTRLAYALILASGVKHGLIVTEPYLVPEIVRILKEQLPIQEDKWQVITRAGHLDTLRTINIIATNTLRTSLYPDSERIRTTRKGEIVKVSPRVTFAHKLRGRIGMAIVDEGEMLASTQSKRTTAVWRLRAKKLFVLTGTPIPSYPRNLLPILSATVGSSTAGQPYGMWDLPYLDRHFKNNAAFSARGIDKFSDDFISTEWVTREFEDGLEKGGKREVPKLRNLIQYRNWLGLHVKRRLLDEPDVSRYVTVKKPIEHEPIVLDWEPAHLAQYLRVADEFANWWKRGRDNSKQVNLVALLARINAVILACNAPQRTEGDVKGLSCLSSKQTWVLQRLEQLVAQGHKIIVYSASPDNASLFVKNLAQRGIDALEFSGRYSITERSKLLKERFREGSAQVLCATKACSQAGLNIPEADYVLFYDRAWMAKVEQQAIARAVRPEQKYVVQVERAHLRGSIDEYMAQMCAFKADIAKAGLDWGTPELEDAEFLHMDMIMNTFVDGLASMHGEKGFNYRNNLKELAA